MMYYPSTHGKYCSCADCFHRKLEDFKMRANKRRPWNVTPLVCEKHNTTRPMNYKTGSYADCKECEAEIPPPIPKEAKICTACNPTTMSEIWNTHTCEPKCDFCKVPCGQPWCCMKDEK